MRGGAYEQEEHHKMGTEPTMSHMVRKLRSIKKTKRHVPFLACTPFPSHPYRQLTRPRNDPTPTIPTRAGANPPPHKKADHMPQRPTAAHAAHAYTRIVRGTSRAALDAWPRSAAVASGGHVVAKMHRAIAELAHGAQCEGAAHMAGQA